MKTIFHHFYKALKEANNTIFLGEGPALILKTIDILLMKKKQLVRNCTRLNGKNNHIMTETVYCSPIRNLRKQHADKTNVYAELSRLITQVESAGKVFQNPKSNYVGFVLNTSMPGFISKFLTALLVLTAYHHLHHIDASGIKLHSTCLSNGNHMASTLQEICHKTPLFHKTWPLSVTTALVV